MKKNLIQRVLCTALSVVMAASSVVVAAADNDDIVTYGTVYHANQKLQKQSQKRIPFLTFNGAVDYDNFVPHAGGMDESCNEGCLSSLLH